MNIYVLFTIILIFYLAVFFNALSSEYILIYASFIFFLGMLKVFLDNLDHNYYNDKKYFWSFCSGMFLLTIYILGIILESLGYIEFIAYFIFLWGASPTLYIYGIKRLRFLQMLDNRGDEKIIQQYNWSVNALKTMYFLDVLIILLQMLAILKWIK